VRILYLGLPLGALHLARRGHGPRTVLVGSGQSVGLRRLRREVGRRGSLILVRPDLEDPAVLHVLRSAQPDVLLSFFWPRRIPASVLALPHCGAFGTHPSLLPRWRGPDPYFWALRRGDRETGVTLHRLTPDYDTGAIVAQRRMPIVEGENAWQLARRLDPLALELLTRCADDLAAGCTLEGRPQSEADATWAPAPDDDALIIDWQRPADDIVRLIRAAAPWPGARALLGDREVHVLAAWPCPTTPPSALRPAEAWRTPQGMAVRAGEGAVLLERLRTLDGDTVSPEALLAQP
jgi:methionyl-tRNA formyltransferase